jgi:hypothetical protein
MGEAVKAQALGDAHVSIKALVAEAANQPKAALIA